MADRDVGKANERIEDSKGKVNAALRDAWRCLEMSADVVED